MGIEMTNAKVWLGPVGSPAPTMHDIHRAFHPALFKRREDTA